MKKSLRKKFFARFPVGHITYKYDKKTGDFTKSHRLTKGNLHAMAKAIDELLLSKSNTKRPDYCDINQ